MSSAIPNAFFRYIVVKCVGQINTVLIGYCHDYPHGVGELIGEVEFLAGFGGLFSIGACNYARYFSDLLGQNGHICKR